MSQKGNEESSGSNLPQDVAAKCFNAVDKSVEGANSDRSQDGLLEVLKESLVLILKLPCHECSVWIFLVDELTLIRFEPTILRQLDTFLVNCMAIRGAKP